MKTIVRESLNEIFKEQKKYNNPVKLYPDFLFRGQSGKYKDLLPSLTRIIKNKNISNLPESLELEEESINKYKIRALSYLDIRQTISMTIRTNAFPKFRYYTNHISWMMIMQHFNAPTRCLDWTKSLLVATYFACKDNFDQSGYIWIANNTSITDQMVKELRSFYENTLSKQLQDPDLKKQIDKMIDSNKRPIIWFSLIFDYIAFNEGLQSPNILQFIEPTITNERIEAQQGYFSICSNPTIDHKDVLDDANVLTLIEIPPEKKRDILSELYTYNINANTLFPGIDGLGKSIKEFCTLWDKKEHPIHDAKEQA